MGAGKVNVAVVGLGFGSAFVPIYKAHPDVGLVGICDIDPERVERVGAEFGIDNRFTSLSEVLADDRFGAIHLLTPVPDHATATLAVLNARRHCACAVPMATTLADLFMIVEAARASDCRYMMMETGVYDRAYLYAKDLLDRGELGSLTFLRGDYHQNLDGGFPRYWHAMPPMHYATHSLSPLFALAGAPAESVSCLGSGLLRPDLQQPGGNRYRLQTAHFRLAGCEIAVQISRSWLQMARGYSEAISVYGDLRGFEWQQIESDDPVLYTLQPYREGGRGREVTHERVRPPLRPDLYPTELEPFARGWHGGSHPHLVHEFVRSIVEQRPTRIDAATAANWTAAGICANDSALLEAARVSVPRFDV